MIMSESHSRESLTARSGRSHKMAEEPQQKKSKVQSDGYKEAFLAVFPELVDCVTKDELGSSEIGAAFGHFKSCLEYTVPGGKLNRGLMVVGSLKHLETDTDPKVEKLALILGWCVELLQACFLVADDIMDQSKTRRGKQCWYLKDGVGLVAINDSLWLESVIYEILRKFIRKEPYYLQVLELFQEVSYLTKVGQCLDTITAPEDDVDLDRFSLEKYEAIVKYKTAFYSFYLPVGIAMYMAGIYEEQAHKHAKEILLQMGEFFQIQDDFLDCFGDPAVTGKIGTDIEDNKCSWLVVQALARVTPQQRALLEANYGRKDPEYVQRVKEMYQELKLEEAYHEYEEKSYARLLEKIAELQTLPGGVFLEFANRIYKRNA